MALDRFSDLPNHVMDTILSNLTIRDVVRTSVLSSKWRYKWALFPYLVFDRQTLPFSAQNEEAFAKDLANVIDHVLLLHYGLIEKVKLGDIKFLPVRNIDRWIIHLSRSSIKEFILELPSNNLYNMPSCLFYFQNLTHLRLTRCSLTPPSTFKGFMNLRSLDLEFVWMSQDGCEKLISSCPVLQRLTLYGLHGVHNLNVNAPNLQTLRLYAGLLCVTLENTLRLSLVSIYLDRLESPMNLFKCFANLPILKRLEINENFIAHMCSAGLATELPKLGANLHHVLVAVNFNVLEEVLAIFYILQSVPNLQELRVVSCNPPNEKNTEFWEATNRNCSFTQLRCIKISPIKGLQYEKDFIKHMLVCSPVLESMTIYISEQCIDKCELVKKLLGFKRASTLAVITPFFF